jgi:hypothetical protein
MKMKVKRDMSMLQAMYMNFLGSNGGNEKRQNNVRNKIEMC